MDSCVKEYSDKIIEFLQWRHVMSAASQRVISHDDKVILGGGGGGRYSRKFQIGVRREQS